VDPAAHLPQSVEHVVELIADPGDVVLQLGEGRWDGVAHEA
jgi:hypothetical protein